MIRVIVALLLAAAMLVQMAVTVVWISVPTLAVTSP